MKTYGSKLKFKRRRVMKKKILSGLATGFLLIGMVGMVSATPIVTFGTGSAVTSIDRIATFDAITAVYMDISNYTENMINVSVIDSEGSYVGFDAFLDGTYTQFLYGYGGNDSYATITTTDTAIMTGLEFKIGHGSGQDLANTVWETYLNGSITGSGTFTTKRGNIVGWSDQTGFDELRVGAYGYDYTALGQEQSIAIDDLAVQATAPVPEPATMLLFGTGLAGLVGSRLRRKKK